MTAAAWWHSGTTLRSAWRRRWPPALGWPAALAAALLVLAGVLQWGWLPAWHAELAQSSSARLGPSQVRNVQPPGAAAASAVWPTAEQAPARLADLVKLAEREGLDLRRSRERLDAGTATYVLEMQARGSYESLRSFLARAFAADAALALESLRIQRPASEGAALTIELQWRLLHQPSGPASRPAAPTGGLR